VPDAMRAAVVFGAGDIRVVQKPVPVPGPYEVLARVGVCGTCATDLKILDGHFPDAPPFGQFTPGHEWAGTVVARGEAVQQVAIGDRVCIEAHHGCGYCENCKAGKYTSCLNYGKVSSGHRASGLTTDGGFAEYVVHHAGAVYQLPGQVSLDDAVLLTTAGTGIFGLDVAGGFVAGDRVVVIGPGPVGLMTVQVCRRLGAGRVLLVGTRPSRLTIGQSLGADEAINATSCDPVAAVLDATDGQGADLVIDASGGHSAPQQCVEMVKRGGKILILAYYSGPVTFDLSMAVRKGVCVFTSRGEGGDAVRRAVSLASRGLIRCGELISHRFALEEISEAFRVLRQRDGDPLKVAVVP
jgi:2-desacetyl-2-hydroxyethyl bacteriochlorophyllide A dehydrogenase